MLAGKCIVFDLSKALNRTFEKGIVVSSQCLGHRVRFIHHLYLQPEIIMHDTSLRAELYVTSAYRSYPVSP